MPTSNRIESKLGRMNILLPYNTRVKRFVDETGMVEMEYLNERGQWMSTMVDEIRFKALTGGTDVFYTEFDQDWDDYTDELWVPDAEREYQEVQHWNKEYDPQYEQLSFSATEMYSKGIIERYTRVKTKEEDSKQKEAASRENPDGTGYYLAQR